jgi:hypothetical protein
VKFYLLYLYLMVLSKQAKKWICSISKIKGPINGAFFITI